MGRWLVLSLVVLASVGRSGAGAPLAARGVESAGTIEVSHGWIVLDQGATEGDRNVLLAHLAPRATPGVDDRVGGAKPGTAKRARSLARRPDAIAADGDRVALIFPVGDDGTTRRVLSLRAVPTPLDDVWAFDPADRLDPLLPLLSADRIKGAGFVEGRLVVMLEGETPSFAVLSGDGWRTEPVDPAWSDANMLVDGGRGLLVQRSDAGLIAASLTLDGDGVAVGDPRALTAPASDRLPDVFVGGELVWLDPMPETGRLLVIAWRPGTAATREVAIIDPPGPIAGAIGLGERGSRLVVLAETESDGSLAYHATELSMVAGDVLFEGIAKPALPVSPQEFRLLAAALVGLMAVTLLVAVKPGGDAGVCALPDGVALAGMGARSLASLIDFVLTSGLVSSTLGGVSFLSATAFLEPGTWVALGGVLVVAAVLGTAFEASFGVTPGKAVCGCRVVRCGAAGLERPSFGALAMRNAIKWLLPPIAILSLVDGSRGRHRGDSLANAAVVTLIRPDGVEN
ncbi:MAG: RDD family protein [Planctomycetota bacterium]